MQCHDAREAVAWARDHHAALADETRAHLTSCCDCRAYAAGLETLATALDADPAESPRPGFDTRFFARLDEIKARPERSGWRRWGWVGALVTSGAAAALLITLSAPVRPPPEDLELAMHLELLEELAVVSRLEEIETFETLALVNDLDLGGHGEGTR